MNDFDKGGLGFLFLYIGVGIALCFTVVSGIRALFGIIDHLVLADSVSWYILHRSTELPVSAAFLLVSFFVLFILMRKTRSVTVNYHGTTWHTLCRIIILIVMTVAVGMAGVSVSLLFGGFLSGDISLNGFFKMIFVSGVSAVVFYYYRGVLHGIWRGQKKEEKIFVSAVCTTIALVVVTAGLLSNPFNRSGLEETYEKLVSIQNIYHSLEFFYNEEGHLPVSLDDESFAKDRHHLNTDRYNTISYEVVDAVSFNLCADFAVLPEGVDMKHYPYSRFKVGEIGKNCFEFTF